MIKRFVLALVFIVAPAAFAQTFILPQGDCGAMTLRVSRGTDFPNLGEGVAAEEVERLRIYLAKDEIVWKRAAGPHSLDYTTSATAEGLLRVAISLERRDGPNETRTDHAKALLRCHTKGTSRDFRLRMGLPLEIYPQWNEGFPLTQGHPMRFVAVDNTTDQLIRGVRMELYRADGGHVGSGSADKSGIVTFPNTEPGVYMVTTTHRRPDPDLPGHWLVDTSSLTFDIK